LRLNSGPARSPLSDGKTSTVGISVVNADGSYTQSAASTQQDLARESQSVNGVMAYESNLDNEVNATGTLNWDSSGNFLGPSGSTTRQSYRIRDSLGRCDDRALNATEQKLTSVAGGPWLRPPQALTDPCHRPSVPQLAAASSIIQAQSPLQPDVLQLQHTEALAAKWLSPQGKETRWDLVSAHGSENRAKTGSGSHNASSKVRSRSGARTATAGPQVSLAKSEGQRHLLTALLFR
jgi:hypothetical protein